MIAQISLKSMISIHRALEVVGIGQCARMVGLEAVINLPLDSPEKVLTASSRVGDSCGV